MESSDYKTDKLGVVQSQQALALQKFIDVEGACKFTPMSFLKNNFNYIKIRDRKTEPSFKYMLAILWSKVCTLGGLKNEIDPFMAEDVNRMILSLYSDLTLEEIYKAFELERHGAYADKTDHYQLFSADYVSTVLKKYKSWKQAAKLQHNISPDKPKEEVQLSDQEKRDIMDKALIRSFDEYLANSEISIPCGHIFDELYERKMFEPAPDYPRKYEIAKFQLEKELKAQKSPIRQERNKIKEAIENLTSANNEKVLARAKQLVLKDYFDYLKLNNTHIKEFINQIP